MNIEEAILAGTQVSNGSACRLGRWLNDIPEATPGREKLLAIMAETDQNSPDWRTLEQIDAILRKLGLFTSNKTVANHRTRRCRCYL